MSAARGTNGVVPKKGFVGRGGRDEVEIPSLSGVAKRTVTSETSSLIL